MNRVAVGHGSSIAEDETMADAPNQLAVQITKEHVVAAGVKQFSVDVSQPQVDSDEHAFNMFVKVASREEANEFEEFLYLPRALLHSCKETLKNQDFKMLDVFELFLPVYSTVARGIYTKTSCAKKNQVHGTVRKIFNALGPNSPYKDFDYFKKKVVKYHLLMFAATLINSTVLSACYLTVDAQEMGVEVFDLGGHQHVVHGGIEEQLALLEGHHLLGNAFMNNSLKIRSIELQLYACMVSEAGPDKEKNEKRRRSFFRLVANGRYKGANLYGKLLEEGDLDLQELKSYVKTYPQDYVEQLLGSTKGQIRLATNVSDLREQRALIIHLLGRIYFSLWNKTYDENGNPRKKRKRKNETPEGQQLDDESETTSPTTTTAENSSRDDDASNSSNSSNSSKVIDDDASTGDFKWGLLTTVTRELAGPNVTPEQRKCCADLASNLAALRASNNQHDQEAYEKFAELVRFYI